MDRHFSNGAVSVFVFIMAMSNWAVSTNETPICPVQSCECAYITLELLHEEAFLLNCSDQRTHFTLHYLPMHQHIHFALQRRQPYFADFKGSYANIGALDMSNNNMRELKYEGFRNFTSLKSLDLSRNNLKEIKAFSFTGLNSTRILNLSHNSISFIEPGALGKLLKLFLLDMNDNRLHRVGKGWFQELPNLQHLSLQGNGLIGIDEGAFAPLVGLKTLSLANNQLFAMSKTSLKGLDQLETLDLSRNVLNAVPSAAYSGLTELQVIILDANPIKEVTSFAFQKLSIRTLSMSRMSRLKFVEANAFTDLPSLNNLQLHSNPKLIYISPTAFHNLPALKTLNISYNALFTISPALLTTLPGLKTISLVGNPLLCDCNILWIKTLIDRTSDTRSQNMSLIEGDIRRDRIDIKAVTIETENQLLCNAPVHLWNTPVVNLTTDQIPLMCPPTILQSVATNYQENIGDDLELRCVAIGIPEPHIHWITPTNRVLNGSSNMSRFRFQRPGTLKIQYIKPMDSGTYACRATNNQGADEKATVVKVHSNSIHLLQITVASNFITLTWNGSASTITTSDYLIMYRKSGTREEYRKIEIHPYMRTYTFTHLAPLTR